MTTIETRTQGSPESLRDYSRFLVYRNGLQLLLAGDRATIIRHRVVPEFGTDQHEVFQTREFRISKPYFTNSDDMGPAIVPLILVTLQLKRARGRWRAFHQSPLDQEYFTVERNGRLIFDSRNDVAWPPNRRSWRADPPTNNQPPIRGISMNTASEKLRTVPLAASPTAQSKVPLDERWATIVDVGTVRVTAAVCGNCGRPAQPYDAERIGDHGLRIICAGCHQVQLEMGSL
jgi:hypothetical protein